MINLQHRKNGLGASESAAALGYSQYQTPLDIYLQKLGLAPAFEGNAATKRGNRLEPIVAQYFQDDIENEFDGAKVYTVSELFEAMPNFQFPSNCVRTFEDNKGTDTFVSIENPFMFSSPDRILIIENDYFGVEIKTANDFGLKTAEDVIEKHQEWLFQCHYNMIVTGLKKWYLVWVNDFNLELHYFVVDYEQELASEIIKEIGSFWHNHILSQVPPDPQTVEDIIYLYPTPTSEPPLEATNELFEVLKEYEGYKSSARLYEAQADALKDKIACAVGNSSLITFGGVKVATYNAQTSKRIDTDLLKKEMPGIYEQYCRITNTRVLRITKPKKEK